MRLFFAVFPPPEVQRAAFAMEEALRRIGNPVSWVRADNLHYTLRFMGDLGADGARRCGEAADEAAAAIPAFDAALGGLGAFPKPVNARVLWIGLAEGAEPLTALAKGLDAGLRKRGFDRADKPFSAHLTIGRVRNAGEDWGPRLAGAPAADPATARFRVDRLRLMESKLSPKGSTYSVKHEAKLAG